MSRCVTGLLGVLVLLAGCSKPTMREGFTEAYGTITLDGAPLVNAEIIFETPKGMSYGRTDSAGKYTAQYSRTLTGAGMGTARVRISTKVVFPDDSLEGIKRDPKTGEYAKTETVPAIYNSKSTLTVEIKNGGAPYDFELKSKPG
ncbi:MAG TPA: hypothetical protein VM452_07165 [Caulifigura sp.]|nr:hypothetical protein [Caulifigura sp.]